MKSFAVALLWLAALAASAEAVAQERVARTPSARAQENAAVASPGQAALDRAAAENKYLFIFFYKEKNPATDAAWNVFDPATGRLADKADAVAVNVTDPAEKPLVDRFDLTRAPMPLVLAIAPNGAITKAIAVKLDEKQLASAFVSPCTQQCMKALQGRKLVLLCVQQRAPQQATAAIPQGVAEFAADPRFAQATEVVVMDPRDESEAAFMKDLAIDPRAGAPVTVFLAPPGTVVGKFAPAATKEQLAAKLATAQSNPCAGGKCGPNGCGPKK